MGLKDWFNKGKQGSKESSGDDGGKVVPLRDIEVQVSGFGVGGSLKHNQKSGIESVTDAASNLYLKGVEHGHDSGRKAGQLEGLGEGFGVGYDRGVEDGYDYGYRKAIEDILKAASEGEEEE